MFCRKCGKEIEDTWVKCPYCGTKVIKEEETNENGRKDESQIQPITEMENVNVPQNDPDSFNSTNGKKRKNGGGFVRFVKKLIKIFFVLLLIIGPFTGTEFGTTKDYVLEVIKYYVSLLLIVGPVIALVCNIRGIRDKLPLFKKHKLSSTILASFIVYLLIGIVGLGAYGAIDTFHTKQYYEEYKADQEVKLAEAKAKKEAEEKAREEQEKKAAEEKAKEEQEQKEAEKKAKEEQETNESEEATDITGDIIQDAKDGLLYVRDGKIVDSNGKILDQYSDYTVLDNGSVATSDYVVEGISVEANKIVFAPPQEEQEVDINQYTDSLVYTFAGDAWKYAESNNIDMFNFVERKNILEFTTESSMSALDGNLINVEESMGLFSDAPSYKRTLEDTEYYYVGAVNQDSEPEGLGMLLNYDWSTDTFGLKYVGYFKGGMFDGYGLKSEAVDEMLGYGSEYLDGIGFYEGYFKEGKKCGKGMEFNRMLDAPDKFYVAVGDYADDVWNGEIKEYHSGNLAYVGETKDGVYDGKGVKYNYQTGQVMYEGNFKNGTYDGKGTLYDENGDVVYEGEFQAGDIK